MSGPEIRLLERVLQALPDPCVVVEVGVAHGGTARFMAEVLQDRTFTYWGVDSQRDYRVEVPFEGANILWMDSWKAADHVPSGVNLCLIDGCHCKIHVAVDGMLYRQKIAPGGFLAFHDVAPGVQGCREQTCEFGEGEARKGVEMLEMAWEVFGESDGKEGMIVYRR